MASKRVFRSEGEKAAIDLVSSIGGALGNRSIRLTEGDVQWELTGGSPRTLVAHVPDQMLQVNIQKDGPSAPTFALVAAYWAKTLFGMDVRCRVILENRRIQQKLKGKPITLRAHKMRALLLLADYKKLFGVNYQSDEHWKWNERLVLNSSLGQASIQPAAGDKPEKKIEKQLAREPRWAREFFEPCRHFGNQLPLGVFKNAVAEANTLTPGKASQLDLWGESNFGFNGFELKAGGNIKVGLLSQAFFYARLLQRVAFDQPGEVRPTAAKGPLADLPGKGSRNRRAMLGDIPNLARRQPEFEHYAGRQRCRENY